MSLMRTRTLDSLVLLSKAQFVFVFCDLSHDVQRGMFGGNTDADRSLRSCLLSPSSHCSLSSVLGFVSCAAGSAPVTTTGNGSVMVMRAAPRDDGPVFCVCGGFGVS